MSIADRVSADKPAARSMRAGTGGDELELDGDAYIMDCGLQVSERPVSLCLGILSTIVVRDAANEGGASGAVQPSDLGECAPFGFMCTVVSISSADRLDVCGQG